MLCALAAWPADLASPGDYTVRAPRGVLWFEMADYLLALRHEAETRIGISKP